ncbi:Nif3-like dinuclear metal center hexameric protein [Mucilaginibacter segetis]|uniref:Nif3-like dinuclear metal center hexameric protein n=1 Tax=Mucilaginibacter segetis TaxID=2793071 RepID=A0A934UM25_9SPHI|nr:Nif3-like dinuclear metal center hexameric protein [Mucilaginibacter segetis]MBK0378969.1 Nif3-like dinuclear metal center hexameric protein [Mucilaginibacter segetis]
MKRDHLYTVSNNAVYDRRKFITNTITIAGGLTLLGTNISCAANGYSGKIYTVQQIIDLILKEGNLLPIPDTVDTIKAGSADMKVTGIVTTMFATVDVIKKAAKLNANFIIAHEPTFYNHRDDTDWVKNNSVVKQKEDLLKKLNITVWRFHDYIHSLKPDAIYYGVVKKAGWLPYFKAGELELDIPAISLQKLVEHLKTSLNISHLRIIGDPQQICKKIALFPGAPGGQRQQALAESIKPDVLIVGELSEWETAEYIRDEQLLGGKTSLIILGHAASETPGMEYFVDWLQPKLPDMKITYIASGDPFTWL